VSASSWSETATPAGRTDGAANGHIGGGAQGRRAGAYAAALSSLPGMGPATLAAVLRQWEPREAWDRVRRGQLVRPDRGRREIGGSRQLAISELSDIAGHRDQPDETIELFGPVGAQSRGTPLGRRRSTDQPWRDAARFMDPESWWASIARPSIGITWLGDERYPAALAADPEPPAVLFWVGSLEWLDRQSVAVVGTRNATPDGRAVAFELGRDLAAAGIPVISGLALGIDGAAHAGVLRALELDSGSAGPVGVAASGLDVPYPRRHAGLWRKVAATGVLLSENLPGRPAEAWRFPSRNRVIAGLSQMVVVVESHDSGGSLLTVEAAIHRGIEVRVVPGPVHSPASAGTNQLLYDGAGPIRHARDVLDALGMLRPDPPPRAVRAGDSSARTVAGPSPGSGSSPPPHLQHRAPARPKPHSTASNPTCPSTTGPDDNSSEARVPGTTPGDTTSPNTAGPDTAVLGAVGWRPSSFNEIVGRSGCSVAATAKALDDLEASGWVTEEGGWWSRSERSR
jgi:DNA protecting protein DprA